MNTFKTFISMFAGTTSGIAFFFLMLSTREKEFWTFTFKADPTTADMSQKGDDLIEIFLQAILNQLLFPI